MVAQSRETGTAANERRGARPRRSPARGAVDDVSEAGLGVGGASSSHSMHAAALLGAGNDRLDARHGEVLGDERTFVVVYLTQERAQVIT